MITTKQIEKLVELAVARRDNLAKADRDIYGADFDAITKINAACRRIDDGCSLCCKDGRSAREQERNQTVIRLHMRDS